MKEKEKGQAVFGMGMMREMMQGMMGSGAQDSPIERCVQMDQGMAGAFFDAASAVSFATPEIRGLFEEWARAVEEEIIGFVKEKGRAKPSDLASHLKISEESALYLVGKMAREKKLKIDSVTL